MKTKVKIIESYQVKYLEVDVNEFLSNYDVDAIQEINYSTCVKEGVFCASCLIHYIEVN